MRECDALGEQINLVMLGHDYSIIDRALKTLPYNDFRFRPLIAMVCSHAEQVVPSLTDGSMNGCDVLLPKPMSASWARVLVETSFV